MCLVQNNILPFSGCNSIFFSVHFKRKPCQCFENLRNHSLVIPPALGAGWAPVFLSFVWLGCVPGSWRGVRAAVLVMKGLFSRLALLSWALRAGPESRGIHAESRGRADAGPGLSTPAQTSTGCDLSVLHQMSSVWCPIVTNNSIVCWQLY